MLMRRWLLLILIGTVVSLSIAECASSLVLFRFYAHKELPFQPNGMAITYLFKKAFGLFPPVSFTADPPYMFRPDPILGYALNPGRYQVIEDSGGNGLHGFKVTIGADGERATSYSQQLSSRRLYVLGNSHAWGFGLDDEMTIAWMLQTRLKEFKVLNLSVTGYSELQSLLQFRALAPQLTGDDIVVFSYDDDLMHNNVGDTAEAFGRRTGKTGGFRRSPPPLRLSLDRGRDRHTLCSDELRPQSGILPAWSGPDRRRTASDRSNISGGFGTTLPSRYCVHRRAG